jgi:hypothetical protein
MSHSIPVSPSFICFISSDITQRLYEEATTLRRAKEKAELKEQQKPKREVWSCPLCCTYHEPAKGLGQAFPAAEEVRSCGSCGWTGAAQDLPFKPVGIDLQYELTGQNRSEMIWNSYKRRGVENFPAEKSNNLDVHEYLYRDNLHQVRSEGKEC